MEIIRYSLADRNSIPCSGKICYALGFFDGVHSGHRELIGRCIEYARKNMMTPAVFTFSSEEDELKRGISRLYSTEDKLRIFESLGVELTVVCDFPSVKELSPRDFTNTVLVDGLSCGCALFGTNFRFAKGASGDAAMLCELLSERNVDSIAVPLKSAKDGRIISASAIRTALSEGKIELANEYLGAPYFISGTVEHGFGMARTFGFPTVNTPIGSFSPLKYGVYETELLIDGIFYTGLTNVGVCPTFGTREEHAETTILDYSGDLYGKELRINFLRLIREEMKFSSAEQLALQIKKDMETIKHERKLD